MQLKCGVSKHNHLALKKNQKNHLVLDSKIKLQVIKYSVENFKIYNGVFARFITVCCQVVKST